MGSAMRSAGKAPGPADHDGATVPDRSEEGAHEAEVGATGAEAFDATYAGLATYRGGVAWDSRGVVIR